MTRFLAVASLLLVVFTMSGCAGVPSSSAPQAIGRRRRIRQRVPERRPRAVQRTARQSSTMATSKLGVPSQLNLVAS